MDYDSFEQWLQYKRLSAKTARIYRNRIRQAIEDLGFDPRRHSPERVAQWVHERGGTPQNQNSWVGALKRFQEYCIDKLRMNYHFADRLKYVRRPKRLPRPISMTDVIRILEATPTDTLQNLRDRAILEMLYCGLRNEEVCNSELRNYRDKEVRIIGKGNKERIVPINDQAWDIVMRYALAQHAPDLAIPEDPDALNDAFTMLRIRMTQERPEQLMFLSSEGNPLSTRRVREIVSKAVRRAGVQTQATPHMFRHSFATHVLDCGATDLMALMHILGHSSLEMTKRYVEVSRTGRGRVNAHHPRQLGVKVEELVNSG